MKVKMQKTAISNCGKELSICSGYLALIENQSIDHLINKQGSLPNLLAVMFKLRDDKSGINFVDDFSFTVVINQVKYRIFLEIGNSDWQYERIAPSKLSTEELSTSACM
jgi:hypothetical protein